MVKQLVVPFALVAAFIILVGLLVKNSSNIKIPGLTPTSSSVSEKTIKVAGKTIKVEVVDTKEKREKGLSGRTELPGDTGMLFVFDEKDKTPGFWMKGMLIPIDIIWIRNGLVVKIDKNVPPPSAGTDDSALPIYFPGQTIDHVLEVAGGYSDSNGIIVGSKVEYQGI